ncbi:MAG: agmatine deiminase family protein, partial [Sphingorhabdus sp.]|nr:agmatine deiminase family protein [Sphingorhabdus sp.]
MSLRMLPEWAPHERVWIGFPSDPVAWGEPLAEAQRQIAAFANAV